MRYFKIYNRNVTKSQPFKELSEDQFLADLCDYCLDRVSFLLEGEDWEAKFNEAFEKAKYYASWEDGLDTGDYYLYITDDSKTVLDFNRKNS